MSSILILLSTYNGDKYLSEQLDSLYKQEGVNFQILVRDDGSTDETLSILEQYKVTYGKMTILKELNIGAARSFYRLMEYAFNNMPIYEYYAFCDQDDVWLNNKLKESISYLKNNLDEPMLYYGPAILVDEKLNKIDKYNTKIINNLGANIVSSHSLGCTQVFNRMLLECTIKICDYINYNNSKNLLLHDGWTALVAYSLGNVIVGQQPLIYYRQHSNNVIGSNESLIGLYINRIKRLLKKPCQKSLKCKILLEVLKEKIPLYNLNLIKKCACYKMSFNNKLQLLFDKRIYQYGIIDDFFTSILILIGKF